MTQAAFRLAMRQEGNKWTAYAAKPNTMEGAIWMGSIALSLVVDDNDRKQAFIEIMKGALTDFLEGQGIAIDSWKQDAAPESERSGSA